MMKTYIAITLICLAVGCRSHKADVSGEINPDSYVRLFGDAFVSIQPEGKGVRFVTPRTMCAWSSPTEPFATNFIARPTERFGWHPNCGYSLVPTEFTLVKTDVSGATFLFEREEQTGMFSVRFQRKIEEQNQLLHRTQ
jgi:hypothetical protein